MRAREKPQFIREWLKEAFPCIKGVLKHKQTQGFFGYWHESYSLMDYPMELSVGHDVDYYFEKLLNCRNPYGDDSDYMQVYPPYRETASGLKTLLVTGIHEECPFCMVLQENAKGVCNFMDVVFPCSFHEITLFICDLELYLDRCPLSLPACHKGTLWPVTP